MATATPQGLRSECDGLSWEAIPIEASTFNIFATSPLLDDDLAQPVDVVLFVRALSIGSLTPTAYLSCIVCWYHYRASLQHEPKANNSGLSGDDTSPSDVISGVSTKRRMSCRA